MQIWLINPYGPINGESWRDYSFTMMADALTKAGHDVVWWTSNFSHHFKRFRSKGWSDMQVNEHFIIRLVPTPGYKRNVGLGRFIRDSVFSYRTYIRGKKCAAPDCIVYYESPLSFGYSGQKLAQFHGCPVIFDQMDLWPELIEQIFPQPFRVFANLVFKPVYKNRKKVYSQLDAAIGLARPYLDVVLHDAPVLNTRPHKVIYNGIDVRAFRRLMQEPVDMTGLLPEKNAGEIWAVFAGSLGPSYDILTLLRVAQLLERSSQKVRFIIAGDGPLRHDVEDFVVQNPQGSLNYVGKLAPEMLASLYRYCDIGLCAYSSKSNVEMPDKFYDYTAAGLPVINSLIGEVSDVISRWNLGLQYRAGDAENLLKAIETISSDIALRQKMAKNSFAAALEFDQHVQYAKLVELINGLFEEKRPKRHAK